jgi:hypothetical protein
MLSFHAVESGFYLPFRNFHSQIAGILMGFPTVAQVKDNPING